MNTHVNLSNKPEHVDEWIVSAAIRARDGTIYVKDPPARHPDIIYIMSDKHGCLSLDSLPHCQGFMTNKGRWVNRHEAKAIALSAAQVKDFNKLTNELFTEDVW